MRIFLIRHGRQESKLCNVDVGLAPEGYEQAKLMGERLRSAKIQAVYSSHLIRAVETAKEANRIWQTKHMIIPELREISFGDLEGKSDEQIETEYKDLKIEQDKMERDVAYPGGECAKDVIERAYPVLRAIASGANTIENAESPLHLHSGECAESPLHLHSGECAESPLHLHSGECAESPLHLHSGECAESPLHLHSGECAVAIVTHGGVIRSLVAHCIGLDLSKARMIGQGLENSSITELLYQPESDRFLLVRFNDYAHLEPYPNLLRSSWIAAEN